MRPSQLCRALFAKRSRARRLFKGESVPILTADSSKSVAKPAVGIKRISKASPSPSIYISAEPQGPAAVRHRHQQEPVRALPPQVRQVRQEAASKQWQGSFGDRKPQGTAECYFGSRITSKTSIDNSIRPIAEREHPEVHARRQLPSRTRQKQERRRAREQGPIPNCQERDHTTTGKGRAGIERKPLHK